MWCDFLVAKTVVSAAHIDNNTRRGWVRDHGVCKTREVADHKKCVIFLLTTPGYFPGILVLYLGFGCVS